MADTEWNKTFTKNFTAQKGTDFIKIGNYVPMMIPEGVLTSQKMQKNTAIKEASERNDKLMKSYLVVAGLPTSLNVGDKTVSIDGDSENFKKEFNDYIINFQRARNSSIYTGQKLTAIHKFLTKQISDFIMENINAFVGNVTLTGDVKAADEDIFNEGSNTKAMFDKLMEMLNNFESGEDNSAYSRNLVAKGYKERVQNLILGVWEDCRGQPVISATALTKKIQEKAEKIENEWGKASELQQYLARCVLKLKKLGYREKDGTRVVNTNLSDIRKVIGSTIALQESGALASREFYANLKDSMGKQVATQIVKEKIITKFERTGSMTAVLNESNKTGENAYSTTFKADTAGSIEPWLVHVDISAIEGKIKSRIQILIDAKPEPNGKNEKKRKALDKKIQELKEEGEEIIRKLKVVEEQLKKNPKTAMAYDGQTMKAYYTKTGLHFGSISDTSSIAYDLNLISGQAFTLENSLRMASIFANKEEEQYKTLMFSYFKRYAPSLLVGKGISGAINESGQVGMELNRTYAASGEDKSVFLDFSTRQVIMVNGELPRVLSNYQLLSWINDTSYDDYWGRNSAFFLEENASEKMTSSNTERKNIIGNKSNIGQIDEYFLGGGISRNNILNYVILNKIVFKDGNSQEFSDFAKLSDSIYQNFRNIKISLNMRKFKTNIKPTQHFFDLVNQSGINYNTAKKINP